MADADANKLNRELLRWIQSLDLAYSIKNVKRQVSNGFVAHVVCCVVLDASTCAYVYTRVSHRARLVSNLRLALYALVRIRCSDFSNGFLVAEIMSRYYDKDISMHSYDNGIGVKVKKDNWDQLHKLFSKFPDLEPLVARADMDAIIHCQNGAAVAFLIKLYQCLTKRTIQPTAVVPALTTSAAQSQHGSALIAKSIENVESIPPYAKPTGSALIREKMRDADIAESNDETQINRKVRSIQSQHEETLQLERLMGETPERYPSLRSPGKNTVLRGATKPVRNDDSPALSAQNVVKEVQIKTMSDKSLEKLRVTREAKEHEMAGSGSGSMFYSGIAGASFDTHGGRGAGISSSTADLVQRRKPFDLLSEAVARTLDTAGSTSKLEPRGKDKFESFVDAIHDGRYFTDAESADVLAGLVDDTGLVAAAFVDCPRDFWRFAGLVYPLLSETSEALALFCATQHMLVTLGQQCMRRDSATATLLMAESLLPKIVTNLRTSATKRAPLLQIVYAFVTDSALAHIQTIKRLREALPDDIPLFIHVLSILLVMEREIDDALVDLYYYYCCIGLETPCEKLRAACLSMLVPFLAYDAALVADLLPRLTQLTTRDAWWEVKAQLVIVASCFLVTAAAPLMQQTERDWTDEIELALTIVEREFHPLANLNLRRVGLASLAKTLASYQELVPLYVDVLFSLPPAVRRVMLQAAETESEHSERDASRNELPIRGASGAQYELLQLPAHWDSVAVAKQIYYESKHQSYADAEVVHVLQRCFEQLLARGESAQAAMLYDQMKDYVMLGLLDAGGCAAVAQTIAELLAAASVQVDDVLQYSGFLECLQTLVTRNVDDIRQQASVKLLRDASAIDAASVRRCVQTLRSMCDASTFNASLFAVALDTDS